MFDFNTEKTRLLDVVEGSDHRLKRDQWLNMKRVLDAIQKKLAPVQKTQKVWFAYGDLKGGVSHLKLLLEDMKEEGFISEINDQQGRISHNNSSISFNIRDVYAFEDYKRLISNFYQEIEKDGIKRFPSHYMETIEQWYKLNKLPIIQYNPESGIGNTNGQEFKLKDGSKDYLVFNLLFKNLRSKVASQAILKTIDPDNTENSGAIEPAKILNAIGGDTVQRRKTSEEVTTTITINDITKSIRRKTYLNERQLVQNEGSLTLLAEEKEM